VSGTTISLDFVQDGSPEAWSRLLERIVASDPSRRPVLLHRLTDTGAPEEEPWTPERAREIAERLARGPELSWSLFTDEGPWIAIRKLAAHVNLRVAVSRPAKEAAATLVSLLKTLDGGLVPRFSMAWEDDSDDDELLLEGLHRLTGAAPVLHLEKALLDRLGAEAALRSAATASIEVPGGVVFAIADPGRRNEPDAKRRRRAAAHAIGASATTPLRLLDHLGGTAS
jgi:hypothetical protein